MVASCEYVWSWQPEVNDRFPQTAVSDQFIVSSLIPVASVMDLSLEGGSSVVQVEGLYEMCLLGICCAAVVMKVSISFHYRG